MPATLAFNIRFLIFSKMVKIADSTCGKERKAFERLFNLHCFSQTEESIKAAILNRF